MIEATIHEGMRSRPVIPMIGRRVTVPWQLGEYGVDADTPVLDEHPARAPPRGRLPRPVRVPPRALPGPQARHLRVDPVRRRHPALPRRDARDGRAARRDGGDRARTRPRRRRPRARARRAPQRDDDPVARRAGRRARRNAPARRLSPPDEVGRRAVPAVAALQEDVRDRRRRRRAPGARRHP